MAVWYKRSLTKVQRFCFAIDQQGQGIASAIFSTREILCLARLIMRSCDMHTLSERLVLSIAHFIIT